MNLILQIIVNNLQFLPLAPAVALLQPGDSGGDPSRVLQHQRRYQGVERWEGEHGDPGTAALPTLSPSPSLFCGMGGTAQVRGTHKAVKLATVCPVRAPVVFTIKGVVMIIFNCVRITQTNWIHLIFLQFLLLHLLLFLFLFFFHFIILLPLLILLPLFPPPIFLFLPLLPDRTYTGSMNRCVNSGTGEVL